ncbi:unnamed protein product [Microthlaspi erraticum]|uniref:Uncharacterized protein n=1 Tax=Microthlaspi erraticum TaxID=1685480 RepID=A0A6D2HYU3_9BRAS|nr:unnamed protein product [Microthlaspi erraticum]
MLSKAKKGSHIRTRDNKGFEMKRLSAPQRTGRLGRGLEMGDGHQERSTQLGSAHSIELVAPPPLLLHLQSGCGFLGLGGVVLARSGCRESRV